MLHELCVLFARTAGAFAYRLVSSWGESAEPQPFAPFLTSADDEDLRWYLEDFMDLPMGGAEVRAHRIEKEMCTWGRKLFNAIFEKGEHRRLYNALLGGAPPRLLTIRTEDLDILRLPWEMMADSRGPLTCRDVTIRRQLETAGQPVKVETGRLPLRILLAVSRPDDLGFLDPRHTTRATLDALAPLGDAVVVDFCRPATLARMAQMLSERAYHVVHFDGHATYLPRSRIVALCFEKDEDETADLVRADRLGGILAEHKIPFAVLEACRSGQVGLAEAFRGVAPALLEAGVGSVLSTSYALHVEATKVLLAQLYEGLASGSTVGQALEAGRGALMAKPSRWLSRGPGAPAVDLQDWFLPNLYQRGSGSALVPEREGKRPMARGKRPKAEDTRRPPASGQEPGAFPGKPRCGFFGRARELHRLERRMLRHRAVLLHAMGGLGKTSLAREAAFWWTTPTGLFPDGACFVSFEQAGGAERAVQVLGAYFEGIAFEQRSEAEQKMRARDLFQTKRVLVVWDNFESVLEGATLDDDEQRAEIAALFRAWTDDDKGLGRLLVTCRAGETNLRLGCKMELEGLARPDALSLLYKVMQMAGVKKTHERDALVDLVHAVGLHPLSIELLGPHLANLEPEKIVRDLESLLDKTSCSLEASLELSLERLSKEAREAVKWLGLFCGGVFEQVLLEVSRMDPAAWDKARGELAATSLVRVESEVNVNGRPYLRFHPTPTTATAEIAAGPKARERYVEVYLEGSAGIYEALHGPDPRWGMEVMAREEASFRKAVSWALQAGAYQEASEMGETLAVYLQRAGRLRERDRWTAWLAGEVRERQ